MELSDFKIDGEDYEAKSEENQGLADIDVETNIKGGTCHFKKKRKNMKKKMREGKEERKKEKDRFSISEFEWSLSFE